jgi:hypothetical protein
MCQTANTWSAALLLLFCLTVAIHAVLQIRFLKHLERRYPATWEEWVDQGAWGDESSATYSVGLWYVLSGKYRSLGDNQLAARAARTRLAAVASIAAFASWAVFLTITQASPNFICLLGLLPR